MKFEISFSPGPGCKNLILSKIRNAESSLNICVFTISDNQITREIINAFNRGLEVRIITDNYKMHDTGSDIFELQREGIDVRIDKSDSHMHHKFMVVDDLITITGSYNWTRSAELYNQENTISIEDESFSSSFNIEFERLWLESSEID